MKMGGEECIKILDVPEVILDVAEVILDVFEVILDRPTGKAGKG